ncbi:hypothetical protein [Duganella callida]|uniref:Pilus assembly protein n=1 Tax=Duganella callida TaxID=2561932 RepID=A0A4Y9T109_9BURK|nr:hypothetical protein [Duganella callida]TFW31181.1 hypothetical protein E4L98_00905 [Duganella callida]
MRYLILLPALGVLSACAPLADRFGIDTRITLAQQHMYPDAGRNTAPVDGMDGRSAHAAYERYQKAGDTPAAATK